MTRLCTHKEFLNKLYNNCPMYRNGEFKVLSTYKDSVTPMVIKNKYGYLRIIPAQILRKCKQLKTSTAIFKDNYFRELLREKNKDFRKGKYKLCSEYKGVKEDIFVENRYGILKSTPADLLSGRSPSILSVVDLKSYVHNVLMEFNDDYKTGKFKIIETYKRQTKQMVLEDEFGLYKVHFHNLIRNYRINILSAVDFSENIKNRLIKERGNQYDYSLIKNIKNVNSQKLEIICRVHGVFKQHYGHHKNGSGCPKCGTLSAIEILKENPTGWSYSGWIETAKKSKNFDSFKTYVIRFKEKDSNEEFIKVGRTFLTIHLRFSSINKYYDKEILFLYEDEDPMKVILKEKELLTINKNNRFTPSRFFHGKGECFSEVVYD